MINKVLFSVKNHIKSLLRYTSTSNNHKPPWKILFFGTDEFSCYSLRALVMEYRKRPSIIEKLEVVTTAREKKTNPVKKLAEKEMLCIHTWPLDLNDSHKYDVGLVVSFGHLIPGKIIDKFKFGILNVHASLLPRWRGAAPIIHAIANGDAKTGVTIMKISPNKFDIGDILLQKDVDISPDTRLKDLHQKLGILGGEALVTVLATLPDFLQNSKSQSSEGVTYAPKLDSTFGRVDFSRMTAEQVYNLDRALDGTFPLTGLWNGVTVRLFDLYSDCATNSDKEPGFVTFEVSSNKLRIVCADHKLIDVGRIGVSGKKPMSARDFNNGYVKKVDVTNKYFKP